MCDLHHFGGIFFRTQFTYTHRFFRNHMFRAPFGAPGGAPFGHHFVHHPFFRTPPFRAPLRAPLAVAVSPLCALSSTSGAILLLVWVLGLGRLFQGARLPLVVSVAGLLVCVVCAGWCAKPPPTTTNGRGNSIMGRHLVARSGQRGVCWAEPYAIGRSGAGK